MYETIVKEIEQNHYRVHGIEVFQDGHTVFRHYFDKNTRYPIYSATKSFTSAAIGLAVDDRKLSVDDPLSAYLEKYYLEQIPADRREAFCRLPIRRFLTMSIPGYPFRPEEPDYMAFSMQCQADYTSAPQFAYSNIPAYLTGVACENAVGEHLISYLTPRLLEPLGIVRPEYTNCPGGHFYGASGMKLTVQELRLLGQLFLQKGLFEGKRILSEDWIREATKIQIMNREGGYGYYFWKYQDGYRISGKWGQRCLIIPNQNLIITYLSDMPEGSGLLSNLIEQIVQ